MFTDRVTLELVAGKGGNGIVAWRRERYIAKGGPMGGNGGKGGDIILRVDEQTPSLEKFRNRRKITAKKGQPGGINGCNGKSGQNLVVSIPCGTLLKDSLTGKILCDFTEPGQEMVICRGGRGGRGNKTFKTSTNRAPNICTEGKIGDTIQVELELKLIADIGLIGYPNAGKSTLVSALTAVSAKIAPYPFTTLRPTLGYLFFDDYSKALLADIPGIIEGAAQDKGLGLEFLRHIERTKVLVYVLDASGIDGRDPWTDYIKLREEIRLYNPAILEKPFIVVLNKIDHPLAELYIEEFLKNYPERQENLYKVSAAEKTGLGALKGALQAIYEDSLSNTNT
ncbi:MAG: GTPase ObgE [Chlamydiota bacterium]